MGFFARVRLVVHFKDTGICELLSAGLAGIRTLISMGSVEKIQLIS